MASIVVIINIKVGTGTKNISEIVHITSPTVVFNLILLGVPLSASFKRCIFVGQGGRDRGRRRRLGGGWRGGRGQEVRRKRHGQF